MCEIVGLTHVIGVTGYIWVAVCITYTHRVCDSVADVVTGGVVVLMTLW